MLRLGGIVAVLVVVGLVGLPASPAAAHPTLQATTPAAGYAVAESPREVTLDFGEPVGLLEDSVRLTSGADTQVRTSPAALSQEGRRLSVGIADALAAGTYRVAWQVRGEDGDLVSGGFSFAVSPPRVEGTGPAAPVDAAGVSTGLNVPAAALRWMLFAALALGLGGAAGAVMVGRIRREAAGTGIELAAVPAPVPAAAAVGVVATVGLIVVGGYDLADVFGSRPGVLLGVESVAFAAALGLAAAARLPGWDRLRTAAAMPLLAVLAAEALRTHVAAQHPLAGGVLTAVHLLAAALWVGALAHVLHVAARWRGRSGWTRLLMADYGRLAVWSVIAVIVTGIVQSILLVPDPAELFGTGYGQVLLAKLAVVTVVIGCAVLARRRIHRGLRTGAAQRGPVGRAVRVEIVTLAGVLALTGALTSLTPPAQAAGGIALPPPPVGPALPVGTLAGQVTVAATASAGRLVVRLTTPLDGPYDDPPESPPYRLTVTMSGDELALVPCGTGCFTAPVDWRPGTTTLDLDATAAPWTGGPARLDVTWPPRPAAERLDRVLTAMRAVGPFTLIETVTSDTRADPGIVRDLPTTGADFIAREPTPRASPIRSQYPARTASSSRSPSPPTASPPSCGSTTATASPGRCWSAPTT
ncbi:copper resistance protein CopC [Pseudonocardia sp. KRD-182]|uniref:copper resistance CopC/CopD family protein n=1 Tax=Pseudonocardia oceani TaxID=2792013 RepID=UPI001C49FD6F|nr:copper resistance protein CopC [Pseudonocardia oceani]MBW0108060.1 copper resistance protein CopC [Pseudonocardia oceani]